MGTNNNPRGGDSLMVTSIGMVTVLVMVIIKGMAKLVTILLMVNFCDRDSMIGDHPRNGNRLWDGE